MIVVRLLHMLILSASKIGDVTVCLQGVYADETIGESSDCVRLGCSSSEWQRIEVDYIFARCDVAAHHLENLV